MVFPLELLPDPVFPINTILRSGPANIIHCENHPGQENHEGNMLNIVLLGQAGSGKSASGNTILRTTFFKSEKNSQPVTKECQVEQTQLFGTEVRVIDTPDFFHKNVENSDKHVIECKNHCGEDPCVYLLVIQIGRFTEGKRAILKQLEEAFKSEIRCKTIVLFTSGEQLTSITMDEFIKDADSHLKEILSHCGDRYHLFRNTKPDCQQVEGLMEKIRELLGQDSMFPDLRKPSLSIPLELGLGLGLVIGAVIIYINILYFRCKTTTFFCYEN
uniref:GTPase IMAP family member 8 n=1 Tax=Hucho hucho TaxID=62062 RepID=A0A4W5LJT2_9TELE